MSPEALVLSPAFLLVVGLYAVVSGIVAFGLSAWWHRRRSRRR